MTILPPKDKQERQHWLAKLVVAVAIVLAGAVVGLLLYVAINTQSIVNSHSSGIAAGNIHHAESTQYLVALCESTPGCPAAYQRIVAEEKAKK